MSKLAAKIKLSPVNSLRADCFIITSLKRFCVTDNDGRHRPATLRPGDRPPVERGARLERNANPALCRPAASVNKLLASATY